MLKVPVVAASLLTVAICGLGAGFVSGRVDAHTCYMVAIERTEQGFYAAHKLCKQLGRVDWEGCVAKTVTDKWRAIADADAAYRNTIESRRVQRFVAAGAAFIVQAQQCGVLPDPNRATCDEAALTAYRQAVSRVSAPEPTERGCVFSGCPAPIPPAGGLIKSKEV